MILSVTTYPDRLEIRGTHDAAIARYVAGIYGLHYVNHRHEYIDGWPHTVVAVRP